MLKRKGHLQKTLRFEQEAVVDRHKERVAGAKAMMKKRRGLVEHPFGTRKHRAGRAHFLMRGLDCAKV